MADHIKHSKAGAGQRRSKTPEDRFFRHIVSSMANGVLAVRRDGTLSLMNQEAYRIFSLTPGSDDIGRPFAEVLGPRADIVRVLTAAFELTHLPNRLELRLKDLDRVIGYTLSQVKDQGPDGRVIGAVMFFKDLTQVEQREERERLRDRLESLGEMATSISSVRCSRTSSPTRSRRSKAKARLPSRRRSEQSSPIPNSASRQCPRRRSSSMSATTARACRRSSPIGFTTRSSRPRSKAPDWASAS